MINQVVSVPMIWWIVGMIMATCSPQQGYRVVGWVIVAFTIIMMFI